MIFKNLEKIVNNGQTPTLKKIRKDILDIFTTAVDAVDPYKVVKSKFHDNSILVNGEKIDISSFNKIYLVSFGKGSSKMARAVCESVKIKEGVIITNELLQNFEYPNIGIFLGGHPIPNESSIRGTEEAIKIAKKCKKDDLLIVLISGGGSALFEKPKVSLDDLRKTYYLLTTSGANIKEINTVRKHLSFVKGGQFIKNVECKVVSLIISDVVGDSLEFIASGPTYFDSTTYMDAKNVLEKYNLCSAVPSTVLKVIEDGINGKLEETVKKGDVDFSNINNFVIANNRLACESAKKKAGELGYESIILTTTLEGEARNVGRFLVEKAINYSSKDKIAFISGGETTVKVKGKGIGGRNQEIVLSAVEEINDKNIVFASLATDGKDGNSDAAGAIADGFSYKRALEKRMSAGEFLDENNSYEFFKKLDDCLLTGTTGTNVMDVQILVKYL